MDRGSFRIPSSSTEPPQEPALERWLARLLERSDVDKALLVSGICLAARLVNALAIHQASSRATFRAVVHTEVLWVFERSLWAMVAFWAVMVASGLLLRRRAPENPVYVTLAVEGVTISGVWVAFLTGHFASQAVLVVVGFLVLCYLAFPRRYYFPATAVAALLFVAGSLAERLGWIPYGPLFLVAPGGLGAHPDRTIAFLGFMMIAVALVLIGGALVFMVRRLRASEAQLREESRTDPLTGLPNRRHLLEAARSQLAHAARHRLPISALVIDVDHFKAVNDRFGHMAGDRVLTAVARTLRDTIRQEDTIARLGGEEFVAILPGTDALDAEQVAERCRRSIEDAALQVEGAPCPLTVSVGVAEYVGSVVLTPEEIIARADKALYRAKQAGRNCIRIGRMTGSVAERTGSSGEKVRARTVRTRF